MGEVETFTSAKLDDTIGALELGSLLAMFMFGIVTLQTYTYYEHISDKDRILYRILVGVVWFLELGHTIGVSYEVYHATITLYGQPERLTKFPSLGMTVAIGGLITFIVQSFFAFRLYRLLPRPYNLISVPCVVVAFVRIIAAAVLAAQGVLSPNVKEYRAEWDWLITALLSSSASVDIVIAASMLYYLILMRSESMRRMTRLLDRIIAYTLRSGLITSVTATIMLICFHVMHSNLVWIAIYTFLAKLYSNTFLSALNARQQLRDETLSAPSQPTAFRRTQSAIGFRRSDVPTTVYEIPAFETHGNLDEDVEMSRTSDFHPARCKAGLETIPPRTPEKP